jgi:hypothetical protein
VRGLYARLLEDRALHPDTMDERVGGWGRLLALFRLVTLSASKVTWLDGDLRAEAGAGKYVPRDPFPPVHVANATWRELNAPRGVERAAVTP